MVNVLFFQNAPLSIPEQVDFEFGPDMNIRKPRSETFNVMSTYDVSSTPSSMKFKVTQRKKVVVPELSSPVTGLNIENVFEKAIIDQNNDRVLSDSCPDGNVLRKVASLTAESFGIKTGLVLNISATDINITKKELKIPCKNYLSSTKFDLKSFQKFEGLN